MGLSLKELHDVIVAKGGYSISPSYASLYTLDQLLDNMSGVRSGARFGCSGHSTLYNGNLSLGNMNSVVAGITICSCDNVSGNDGGSCSAVNGQSYGCTCHTNCSSHCSCVGDCGCESDCGCQNYCSCVSYTPCSCENYCSCESDCGSTCDCNCDY